MKFTRYNVTNQRIERNWMSLRARLIAILPSILLKSDAQLL